ncbi:MAG TPA: hypothetical protein VID27_19945, partial [Blastocatellia bacterium]
MKRITKIGALLVVSMVFGFFSVSTIGQSKGGEEGQARLKVRGKDEKERIRKGFQIAPVPLNFRERDTELVGLGSYIVNAQAACADCHSCPTYAPGHNPFQGGDGQINAANYLAGGVPFGPVISANITPDESGKPAGLTFEEYRDLIRTGHDPDEEGEILQVMPWPILRN